MKVWDDSTEMETSAAYWAFQAFYWGIFAAIGLAINVVSGGNIRNLVISHILFFLYSVGLTHVFRGRIQQRRLRQPSNFRMRLWLFAGILVIAVIQTVLVISIDSALNGERPGAWPRVAVFGVGWGMYIGTLVWTMVYVRMTERRIQERKEAKMQLAVRAAELRALEAQINPHFLFNCLNSIRGLVVEDPQKAQDMITRFAALLRYNLNRDRQHTVPFSEEAEIVADYLALESVRFEDRLRVQVTVDPQARAMQVPPMILQALVENALKHGIARRPEGGDVQIHASSSNGKLILHVTNSGELGPARPSDTQLGLKNIRERLHLLYGDRASLSLQNGSGTVVAKVEIPRTA
ncbi:MAG TPA: histidine kinase [Bryobacteraceae bacterium]|nr:histidine kinase [Bryobacteraceae bacterium]